MFELTDKCFVIAEAGTCHSLPVQITRYHLAIAYVDAAVTAGADAGKFQIFTNPIKDDMFCWMPGDAERMKRWEHSELRVGQWAYIKQYAEAHKIMFLASVFQHSTVEMLNELGVEATKVASRAAKDFPYGKSPAPYLISDGMFLTPEGGDVIGLQCEANYPSTVRWMDGPIENLIYRPGFSDHSGTPWRAIDAIAHGCKLVEVHYYIEPEEAGPDYPASLTLDELKLVCDARDAFADMAA